MDRVPISRAEASFIVGVPIAWAVILLFHPGGEGTSIYADLDGDGTRMQVVHVGMLFFIPLFAIAVYLLLRGIESTAARVCRVALPVFIAFYSAWEALQGIANGILVDKVSALPEAGRAGGAELIQEFAESPFARDFGVFSTIGSVALVVAMLAAGLALRGAGAPGWTPAAFGIAGFLISGHPPPFGPTGLVIFAVAAALLIRGWATERPAMRGRSA